MAPPTKASASPRTPQVDASGGRRLLSVDEAAAKLGVTSHWIRRAVAERRIPFIKTGRLLRFHPDDLDAWIAAQRVPAEQ